MSRQTVRLSSDELWTALEDVDLIEVVVDEVAQGGVAESEWRRLLRSAPAELRLAGEVAVLEDRSTGTRCLLPAAGLRDIRTAAVAALAARRLRSSRVTTLAVLGGSESTELQLTVLARFLPGLTHVAIGGRAEVGGRLRDQLELAGIGLSVTDRVSGAVRGANLVHVLDADLLVGRPGDLAKGAVVVNAAGRALRAGAMAGIDQVYVDRRCAPSPSCRIEADLTQLVTGSHPGRAHLDDIVLVALLSTDALSPAVAESLYRSAVRRDLGLRYAE
jgi:hypothetical protein